ncbi:hypothetical protein DICSQDRAFT_171836 [Dichomitus squalens LYAD-421 SS1]|uniref:GH16 domain-containing protein n=1 Tax=Dichomitus squalens (strain LYAD-421) TaxID=732165 RepID=R7SXG5_DICSQ|nr:uncharacterized protein DICSQDRAFT_171836 [Dichomitus squalens LYAD-421 SS1]EJF59657.1 hypothetical protein DICSQDRAFT_171836 [Dichomitus squalens LYAD-421 SS1]
MLSIAPLAVALLSASYALGAFNLVKSYSGSTFFDGWQYDSVPGYDNTTNGHVFYLDGAHANASHLTYVNDAGRAIIKVDNETVVSYPNKRNSVRISTEDFFDIGSVFLFDATHVPYGCSVWPSFWTTGNHWPNTGEIDILESYNLEQANQMTLHTTEGCSQAPNVQQVGKTNDTDCGAGGSTIGCTVVETKANSFGEDFANNQGGVWAAWFDETGISVWFWSRKDVPASVSGATNTIDPTTFGTPSAAWPSGSSCDISKAFGKQQLVIDITLCGDKAGDPQIYQSTCGGPLRNATYDTCYQLDVIQQPTVTTPNQTALGNAWFEISYVKVFTSDTAEVANSSGATAPAAPTSTSANGTSSADGKNDALSVHHMYTPVVVATLLAVASCLLL